MYTILYILLLLSAVFIIYRGSKKNIRSTQIAGISFGLLVILFFWFLGFWGEKLWFDAVGYSNRFWKVWNTKILAFLIAFFFSGLLVYLLTLTIHRSRKLIRNIAAVTGAVIGGIWWFGEWEVILKFFNAVETSSMDPVLGRNTGFYMFIFPFLSTLYSSILVICIISLIAVVLSKIEVTDDQRSMRFLPFESDHNLKSFDSLFVSSAALIMVLAAGRYLKRFELMYSELGIVAGPGWTDDHIRLPLLLIITLFTFIIGLVILFPFSRIRIARWTGRKRRTTQAGSVMIAGGFMFAIWILALGLIPFLFQWLRVEPNEITFEREYIKNNIEFTRQGFNLNKIEEFEYPASDTFTRQMVEENRNLFANIRLWDYRALDNVFKQFQEIRLYYEFYDVDIDRYTLEDDYREVMISAREMQLDNLPQQSQTFVNKRFKYTHGNGIVLTKVNEFTPEGLPNLLIKDIPPVSTVKNLKIEQSRIYYGELTEAHVIANSEEEEFDYPSGEKNVYNSYDGKGGVFLSNLWRKFLFGYKFDGTRFFLSSYPTAESKLMFHRDIKDRIKTIAPFLMFDDDPYITLVDGKLYWIVDAYTVSQHYPYSEPFSSLERIEYEINATERSIYSRAGDQLKGANYIRNAVKVVIDAYNGSVDFYVFEPDDPIIKVYTKIFPGMFTGKENMPENIKDHVRYPADMLLVQGLVNAKYHMTDPTVFYNQEDLWVRATEKYYGNVQPVEPYYIMWEPPGTDQMEFVLILPFTPKNRQVMIGWIAGMCDGENYGRFLSYKFPKEKRVLGPQQVETKIDQDSFLSGQLTLWDQRGSNVIRGNVLAIPVSNTIIYVEPIYLKSETAAYPELRLVAVMHNDQLSYAETFDEALQGLFMEQAPEALLETGAALEGLNLDELIQQANDAFEEYLNSMQQKNFNNAAKALENLEKSLNQLSEQSGSESNQN